MRIRIATALLSTLALACGDDSATGMSASTSEGGETGASESSSSGGEAGSGSEGSTGTTEAMTATTATGETDTDGSTTAATGETGELDMLLCGTEPPEGAESAPPIPTFGGICPTIELGFLEGDEAAPNEIMTAGGPRRFAVVAPEDIDDGEILPVIFMWHWLGGSAHDFYERSEVASAAQEMRFVAVIPESKDDVLFKWPFTSLDTDERLEEEFAFFDDMLGCIDELFPIDVDCVSSTGVSAGALFTGQLAGGRGQHLSSIMSLSGGVGGVVKPWVSSSHTMPAMVLWGGPKDFCVAVDFDETSKALEEALEEDGHFVVECVHNCQHSTPPFDAPMDLPTFAPLWMFALDHPYWLDDGVSPYAEAGGLPLGYPEWCEIGVGSADIRVGECGPDECS